MTQKFKIKGTNYILDAMLFNGVKDCTPVLEWIKSTRTPHVTYATLGGDTISDLLILKDPNGRTRIRPGEWVIFSPLHGFYPASKDDVKLIYDAV